MPEARDLRRDEPASYRICLAGILDASWTDMLDGMTLATREVAQHCHVTTLTGRVVDQAALMGVLNLVYNLGMPLLLVEYDSVHSLILPDTHHDPPAASARCA